jgi:hypothetical protein
VHGSGTASERTARAPRPPSAVSTKRKESLPAITHARPVLISFGTAGVPDAIVGLDAPAVIMYFSVSSYFNF